MSSVPLSFDEPIRWPGMDRRSVLAMLGTAAGSALLGSAPAQAQSFTTTAIQSSLGEGQRFAPATLIELARLLSRKGYNPPQAELPEPFANLNYEQYIGIRALPSAHLWGGENRNFSVEPLHRGFAFQSPVQLFAVEDGQIRRVMYDRARFDYGRLQPPATLPDLGFSGFRVFGDAQGGRTREVAIFQGASFFRSPLRAARTSASWRGALP